MSLPLAPPPTDNPAPLTPPAPPWWPVRAVQLWLGADGLRMSAAMSFYGMLSLAPLLVVVVAALGWWVDRALIENNLLAQIRALTSERIAQVVEQALASAQAPSQGLVASAIALVLLLWGATGVFAELQAALARLWQEEKPEVSSRSSWRTTATMRLRGLAYVAGLAFLLLVSLLISAALAVATSWLGTHFPYRVLLLAMSEGVSFLFATGLFLGLMRISVDPKPRLRYLTQGALIGAALFSIGRHGLAAYLSGAAVVSAYGAAGSLVALLVWIYFSCAVLLLSAGCARALQERAEAL
ncbi:YihY/virulence factor BrkB family protein [Simplicispira psychrophila]|uniref:YihY/virulence factor BrkB family protein n=1 Tax=Simplicispira psychrophila TaxID=80882 RepID=UPI000691F055|nr:YihY/virulence factor BrkB family protein [Simplicispira psychrophila]